MTNEILQKIEAILASNAMIGQENAIELLKNEFLESLISQEKTDTEEESTKVIFEQKEAFQKLIQHFQTKLSMEKSAAEKKKDQILAAKQGLVAKLQDLIQNEQEIGKAIQIKKELQTEWGAIEDHSSAAVRQANQLFHKLLEDFNYNLNLYKAIKDHDFKRNQQIKEEILTQLGELLNKESSIGDGFRVLQKQWFETGPVKREMQDDFWQKFKDASQKVIDKLAEKKEASKAKEKENLQKKEAIISYLTTLLEEPCTKERQWKTKTDLIIEKQKEWKQVGFVPKSSSTVLWDAYKGICDRFFKEKSLFYEGLKEEQKKNKNEKLSLCDKAEAIVANVTDSYEEKTRMLTQLQRNWKNLGQAHPRDEQKLWKKFQDTCNLFFVDLRKTKDQEKVNFEQSLSGKKTLLDQLATTTAEADVLAVLKQWFLLDGQVRNLSSEMNKSFNESIHTKLSASGKNASEITNIVFNVRLEAYAEINNTELLQRELNHSKEQVTKLEEEKAKFENNLGFFKHTKKDNPMLIDLLEKVAKMTQDIDVHKKRLSQIRKLLK